MATVVLADNAYGTIASALAAGDTTLTFTTGHGARFPAVSSASLYCVLIDSSNVVEEIIITAHSASADTATITRGAGSTTAKAWSAGARIEARISSSALEVAYGSTAVQTLTNKTLSSPAVTGTATMSAAVVDGIRFSAVQISSTATNVLDDYEEGTWTPGMGFGGGASSVGVTYSANTGVYTKIGNNVTVSFTVVLTNKGAVPGVVYITGLPFLSGGDGLGGTGVIRWQNTTTAFIHMSLVVGAGTNVIAIYGLAAAATSLAAIADTDIANNTRVDGSATYTTSP